ncbi:MAG: hypothetical protein ACI8ZX_000827 [Planctomycetota bacterium]|jgi:hypothetical protein
MINLLKLKKKFIFRQFLYLYSMIMVKNNRIFEIVVIAFAIVFMFSCEKPEDTFPNSNEAISFKNIDSATIERKAGEGLLVDVVLITDTIIDSLKIGYFIDTLGITNNLTFDDITTLSLATGFTEVNNKFQYAATIKLPANAYGIRPFRPYLNGVGDFVRIIFRMEAGTRAYEKQLKVIIEP